MGGASAPSRRLQLRFRRSGKPWSGWHTLGAHSEHGPDPGTGEHTRGGVSDPIWVGEADYVQYRSSRPLKRVRLHFVNSRGTATAGDRARTAAARKRVGPSVVAAPAQSAAKPAIVPRSAWGASECPPRRSPDFGQIKVALVHHTVNANDYTRAQAPAMVLAICRFHRNSNGWDDIGYNFLVDRFGTIYEGRAGGVDKPVLGSQAAGFNSSSTGISNLGTFSSVPQNDVALRSLANLIRWKMSIAGVPTQGRVEGVLLERRAEDARADLRPPRRQQHGLSRQLPLRPAARACAVSSGRAPSHPLPRSS